MSLRTQETGIEVCSILIGFEKEVVVIGKKYNLFEEECKFVKQAVIQHSGDEWMRNGDEGYDVMAILN